MNIDSLSVVFRSLRDHFSKESDFPSRIKMVGFTSCVEQAMMCLRWAEAARNVSPIQICPSAILFSPVLKYRCTEVFQSQKLWSATRDCSDCSMAETMRLFVGSLLEARPWLPEQFIEQTGRFAKSLGWPPHTEWSWCFWRVWSLRRSTV